MAVGPRPRDSRGLLPVRAAQAALHVPRPSRLQRTSRGPRQHPHDAQERIVSLWNTKFNFVLIFRRHFWSKIYFKRYFDQLKY